MTRVEALEQTIRSLTREELLEFRNWFVEFDARTWDRAIESDAKQGKLDGLAARALAQHRDGKTREI